MFFRVNSNNIDEMWNAAKNTRQIGVIAEEWNDQIRDVFRDLFGLITADDYDILRYSMDSDEPYLFVAIDGQLFESFSDEEVKELCCFYKKEDGYYILFNEFSRSWNGSQEMTQTVWAKWKRGRELARRYHERFSKTEKIVEVNDKESSPTIMCVLWAMWILFLGYLYV